MTKTILTSEIRLNWNDKDWAKYLGCPVKKIPEFKKLLDENFLIGIERNAKTGRYSLAVHRYDIRPDGDKRLRLLISSNKTYDNVSDAVHMANEAISSFELSDFWAGAFGMPKQAIQMMLIREK